MIEGRLKLGGLPLRLPLGHWQGHLLGRPLGHPLGYPLGHPLGHPLGLPPHLPLRLHLPPTLQSVDAKEEPLAPEKMKGRGWRRHCWFRRRPQPPMPGKLRQPPAKTQTPSLPLPRIQATAMVPPLQKVPPHRKVRPIEPLGTPPIRNPPQKSMKRS